VLSQSSTPSEQPSAPPKPVVPLGDAPRSGSNADEIRAQQEMGNAVGTAIGKSRVGSRATPMPPQQQEQQLQNNLQACPVALHPLPRLQARC
jgi:hypothetical protein